MGNTKLLILSAPLITAALILSAYEPGTSHYPGGAPAGYTGSPGDGKNCTQCHGGSASVVEGWITSTAGPEGYIPGETYTVTVTVSGIGKKGFEISPQDPAGNFLGALALGTGTEFAGGDTHYITQSSSSNDNPKEWTFQWTAPAAGSGPVTLYGAFTVNEPVTKLSTLVIPENLNTGIIEPSGPGVTIYPSPARETVNVRFSMARTEIVTVSLVDPAGREVYTSGPSIYDPGEHVVTIPAGNPGPGLYLARIAAGDKASVVKVLISR